MMFNSRFFIALAVLTLLTTASVLTWHITAQPSVPIISMSIALSPLHQPWFGIGVNDDPILRDASGNDIPWTTQTLALTENRIDILHPGLVRMNWNRDWFNPSDIPGNYTWTAWKAQAAFSILDFLHSKNIPVQIGLWHTLASGRDDPAVYTSLGFAQMEADLLYELLVVKGYSNIQWFSGINEPDCAYMHLTFNEWEQSIRNLYTALLSIRLPANLITGPDISCDSFWNTMAANNDAHYLAAYEQHAYHTTPSAILSIIGNETATITISDMANKPFIVSELGIGNPDTNLAVPTYQYGLDMLSASIYSMQAGASSLLAWCLDGFDAHKQCGMWDTASPEQLRPWFTAWAMLSRAFPACWTIVPMTEPAHMQILAAHSPIDMTTHSASWSFLLVNTDTTHSDVVTLQAPGWGGGLFNDYLYVPDHMAFDANGELAPVTSFWTASGGLAGGLSVTVPANSAVMLVSANALSSAEQ